MTDKPPKTAPKSQVTADPVPEAVAWLTEKQTEIRTHLTQQAHEIGDYLIDRFFEGDVSLVASHNPRKNASFRMLCERTDLPFPETALRRFLHVAINFRVLPEDQAMAFQPSHHSVLYQIVDESERRRVGRKAVEQNASVRQLRRMVRGKGRRKPGGGRKREPAFHRDWKRLSAVLDSLSAQCETEGFLDKARRTEVQAQCRETRDRLTKILDRVTDLPAGGSDSDD